VCEHDARRGDAASLANRLTSPEDTKPLPYMPQLDGLRTLAVGGVLAQHFGLISWGAGYGVHLFFVLSGFLITGILLEQRRNVTELGVTRARAFRQFYFRRALRIFPLYYLVVLGGIVLNVRYARDFAPWLLTYTINLKMAAQGWYIDHFAHFWSLAVEEQYYLVWPWLILLLPRRWLGRTAMIAIAIAPLFRFTLVMLAHNGFDSGTSLAGYISTPTTLDSLGIGSLLATLRSTPAGAEWLRKWMRLAIPLTGLVLLSFFQFGPKNTAHFIFLDTSAAILFSWMIYKASRGYGGLIGAFLSFAPIVYLGRISYGIYVFHPFIPGLVTRSFQRMGIRVPAEQWITAAIYAGMTVIVATTSWYVLERPMNNLKRYVPYRTRQIPETAPAIS
jgi:peptidoglycan/LPS O-acetylase OafA/YrhL